MYTLTTEPFYDTCSQCYKNIIVINALPNGPLRSIVRRVHLNKLGPNRDYSQCAPTVKCKLALIGFEMGCCNNGGKNWMTPNEIPDLFSFLIANGYTIDTSITNMMSLGEVKLSNNNKILCFISYKK